MNEPTKSSNDQDVTAGLRGTVDQTFRMLSDVVAKRTATLQPRETGNVKEVQRGIVRVSGLPNARADEVLLFGNELRGFAFNLDHDEIGCVMLDDSEKLITGMRVERTGKVIDTAVGEELLGRVVDPIGRPLDGGRSLAGLRRMPCERDAPPIMDRDPVTVPLQTGLKIVDALIPIGRGQRQLLLGDRQTGKTAIAVDTIINQRGRDVLCIYCSIGQGSTDVARVIAKLRETGSMEHTIVMIAADDAPPGVKFIAAYAATTMGEYLMERGRDVVVIYDDLTSHARSYRHVSLLLRRPPGREAFPGDIFYVHSRLLERATHLRDEAGGGSMTALPIIETEAQNVSAYIPTNLISITDGQIYLSPILFRKGILPAVDVGRSVSRVGGKTQLPAYRAVAGDLRLTYSQFEELEKFARFSSQLDDDTRKTLERGRRIRETLKQPQYHPLDVPRQIASLVAVTSGVFDSVEPDEVMTVQQKIQQVMIERLPQLCKRILAGEKITNDDLESIREAITL